MSRVAVKSFFRKEKGASQGKWKWVCLSKKETLIPLMIGHSGHRDLERVLTDNGRAGIVWLLSGFRPVLF